MLKVCEELRQAVLLEAIQGKLTKQLPSDGDARTLLERIKAEKEKRIKEKKIKKEKPLAPITDEEIPFDIPENWCWTRLVDFTSVVTDYVANGSFATLKANTKTYTTENYAVFVRTMDLSSDFRNNLLYLDKESYEYLSKSVLYGGELILPNIGGSIGKVFVMPKLSKPMSLAPNSIVVKCLNEVSDKYLTLVMSSGYGYSELMKNKGGTATPKFSKTELRRVVIPIPPLAEQQRIAAKVEKLMAEIDELEKVEAEIVELKKDFPGDMKAALLLEAMQGKLTKQLLSDGDARDLLEQIRVEKEQLVKDKKIKKEKPLAPITDDEIPFDIPDNWCWVRLGEISTYSQPKAKVKADKADKNIWLLDLEDIEKGGKLLAKKTVGESDAKGDKTIFCKGNILYSKLRPYLLKILEAEEDGICTPELIPFSMYGKINNRYVINYLKSSYVDEIINSVTYGVKMPRVGTETMVNFCFPLPPLAEQERIVAKLEKLLPLCDGLAEE